MNGEHTVAQSLETTEVAALVTLTVTPKQGQSAAEAGSQMLQLFKEYVTEREYNFLHDYGTTADALLAHRRDPSAAEPSWGGYEGPFVLGAVVRDAVEPVTAGSTWHRQMGDRYAQIALDNPLPAAKAANAAEAAKYYATAERLATAEARSRK